MANEESMIFKVGDVVSLKVKPEFRGVIDEFVTKKSGSGYQRLRETAAKALDNPDVWVIISFLNEKNTINYLEVPILHLKPLE